MAEGQLTMFGKTYNTVGSADSNLVLQTRGDIKVRWGNKFIDLIKNGKINVDVDILKTTKSKDKIYKDGIYLIHNEDNTEVWISINGELINIFGEIGTTYVSFQGHQDVTSAQKIQALLNAGIYYETISNAQQANIEYGIIYCKETNKLYTANNGELSPYSPEINLNDPLIIGNTTISGSKQNIFGKTELSLGINSNEIIKINDYINCYKSIIINNDLSSHNFFPGKFDGKGFSIYTQNNLSTLEIDKVLIRQELEVIDYEEVTYSKLIEYIDKKELVKDRSYIIKDFQNEWELTQPSQTYIKSVRYKEVDGRFTGHDANTRPIVIKAKNNYELETTGYFQNNPEWIIEYDPFFSGYTKIVNKLDDQGNTVTDNNGNIITVALQSKGRITKLTDEKNNVANFDFKHRTFKVFNNTLSNPIEQDEEYLYTFNMLNKNWWRDSANNNTDYPFYKYPYYNEAYHKYADASQTDDTICNNKIFLREPIIEEVPDSETGNTHKIKIFDDFVIFNMKFSEDDELCKQPHDNSINMANCKFLIEDKLFEDNIIENIYHKRLDNDEYYEVNYDFIKNIIEGTWYIRNDYNNEVKFKKDSKISENHFINIENSEFKESLFNNIFESVSNLTVDNIINNNVFKKDINDLHIKASIFDNNNFNGLINTYGDKESYYIDGQLKENTFQDFIKVQIGATTIINSSSFDNILESNTTTVYFNNINIVNSTFGEIKGAIFNKGLIQESSFLNITSDSNRETIFEGNIKECVFGNITGCQFKTTSDLYKVTTYDNILKTYPLIKYVVFEKIIEITTFSQDIIYTRFKEKITRSNFYSTITGTEKVECIFYKVSLSEFEGYIEKFVMKENNNIISSSFKNIKNIEFFGTTDIKKSTFYGDINNLQLQGIFNKSEFNDISGKSSEKLGLIKCNINMSTFYDSIKEPDLSSIGSTIEYCTFMQTITKLKSDGTISLISDNFYLSINDLTIKGTINYCKFNGKIDGVILDGSNGSISNCIFQNLTKYENNKLTVKGALQNVDIHDDINPQSAQWVEKVITTGEAPGYIKISDLPGRYSLFEISTEVASKLAGISKKDCYIRTITKDDITMKIFIVSLGANINTDNAIQGMIVMMSGGYPIPDGWAICNGENGTPDLRGRFIRMVGVKDNTGALEDAGEVNNDDLEKLGENTRQAYLKKVPAHTHSFKTYSDTINADTSGFYINYNGNITHNLSVDTSKLSIGRNASPYYWITNTTGTVTGYKSATEGEDILQSRVTDDYHSHSLSGIAPITGSITLPSFITSGNISVSLTITPEQDTENENFQEAVNIEPQAYALIFIMKL